MNIESEKYGAIDCKKYHIDMAQYDLIENEKGELDLIPKKKGRLVRKSVFKCKVCGRLFVGKYTTGMHSANCFTIRKFDEERERFYNRELDIAGYTIVEEKIKITDFLEREKDRRYWDTPGVWALWNNGECIQVAKNQNIGREIFNDFVNNKGSSKVNYYEYKDTGELTIVHIGESSFPVEAQYAHDHRAKLWNLSFSETNKLAMAYRRNI